MARISEIRVGTANEQQLMALKRMSNAAWISLTMSIKDIQASGNPTSARVHVCVAASHSKTCSFVVHAPIATQPENVSMFRQITQSTYNTSTIALNLPVIPRMKHPRGEMGTSQRHALQSFCFMHSDDCEHCHIMMSHCTRSEVQDQKRADCKMGLMNISH